MKTTYQNPRDAGKAMLKEFITLNVYTEKEGPKLIKTSTLRS